MFRAAVGDVAAFDIASGRMVWTRSLNTGRADHMTLTADLARLFVSRARQSRLQDCHRWADWPGDLVTGVYPHDNKLSRWSAPLANTSIGPLTSLPRSAGAATDGTPGSAFQLTVAGPGDPGDRPHRWITRFRPWQFTPTRRVSTLNCPTSTPSSLLICDEEVTAGSIAPAVKPV
jgi:hypothetical protein